MRTKTSAKAPTPGQELYGHVQSLTDDLREAFVNNGITIAENLPFVFQSANLESGKAKIISASNSISGAVIISNDNMIKNQLLKSMSNGKIELTVTTEDGKSVNVGMLLVFTKGLK